MMRLWRHDRQSVTTPLAAAAVEALVSVFSAKAGAPSDQALELASRTLDTLRDAREWIQCGCRGGQGNALLFPRRRSDGRMELVRHPESDHAPGCALEGTRSAGGASPAELRARHGRYFRALGPIGEEARIQASGQVPREEGKRERALPKALQLLRWALVEAGLNVVRPDELGWTWHGEAKTPRALDINEHYRRLQSRVADLEIEPGVRLGDVCAWSSKAVQWVTRRAQELPFAKARPQAYLLGVALEAEGKVMQLKDGSVEVEGHLAVPGAKTVGPLACLVAYGPRKTGAPLAPLVGAVQPVLSRALLLPVDSGLERKTAELLLGQLSYWQSRGASVELEKPLLNEGVWKECALPDFVMRRSDGRRVIVETMGSKAPEYLARKRETHRQMERASGAIALMTHWPDEDDPAAFRRALTAAVLSN